MFSFKAFHKSCFKCGDCNKGLDSVNVTEGPDKDIYCKGKLVLLVLVCRLIVKTHNADNEYSVSYVIIR